MKRNHIFFVLGWLLPVVAILLNGCRKNPLGAPIIRSGLVVYAGPDQVISLPTDSAILVGSIILGDSNLVKVEWGHVTGPLQYSLTDADKNIARVKHLVAGVYEFGIRATDNYGRIASDQMKLTVVDNNPACAGCWDY